MWWLGICALMGFAVVVWWLERQHSCYDDEVAWLERQRG